MTDPRPGDRTPGGEQPAPAPGWYDDEIEDLYRDYAAELRGYLRKSGHDHAVVDDVVQDSFLALRDRWHYVRSYGRPKAYLYRVATRLAGRAGKERYRHSEPLADPQAEDGEAAGDAADPDTRLDVDSALRCLPPKQRAAVLLCHMLTFTVEEAAAILGCRPGTVKSNLFDARRRLARLLPEDDAWKGDLR